MSRGRDPKYLPPILANKDHAATSVFEPANLLREARRQKGLARVDVPEICLLDPDGDIVRALRRSGRAVESPSWACYHTELFEFEHAAMRFGIIGCAVGGAFAVLIAEELFVSGCRFLLSMTSAGQIAPLGKPPYFVVIDRALRDEGTSYHYLPPGDFADAEPELVATAMDALRDAGTPVYRGASWTTDAPFRETEAAIEAGRARDILAVEMEAAALYAFARAKAKPVLCLAHVTNQMAVTSGDFEKGEADGAEASLTVVGAIARAWTRRRGAVTVPERSGPGRSETCAIAIMAKAPRQGEVKTRLVPPLTAAEATALSAAFIRDTAENILAAADAAAIDGYVAYSPPGSAAAFAAVVPPGIRLLPPRRIGLGASLFDAASDLLAAGYAAVCLVNADSPNLPTSVLVEAARALAAPGDRVVLGGAEDGGYYLIGLKHPHRRLFEDIAWSTDRVLQQTLDRAAEIGLDVHALPVWYDVDDVASLHRLNGDLTAPDRAGYPAYPAPHTSALLREFVHRL